MKHTTLKSLLVATACSALLSACGSDGVSLNAGTGHGPTTAQNGGGSSGGGSGDGGSNSGGSGSGSDSGSGSGSGSGTGSNGGSGNGSTGGGTDGGSQAGLLGNGAVTVTAGETTVGTSPLLNGPATGAITSTADAILSAGNAALPLNTVASAVQPVTSVLPVSTTVSNAQLTGGTGTQPIGISILSNKEAAGPIASVNVASGGKTADVTVLGNGVTSLPSAVLQTASSVTTPVTSTVTGATSGVLGGTSAVANATVGKTQLVSGSNPLLGVSAASPTQNQGSLLTVGALSADKPLTLKVGDKSLLPTGGH